MVERHPLLRTVSAIVLLLAALLALAPIYVALCTASVSAAQSLAQGPALVPGTQLVENLREVMRHTQVRRMLLNSALVALIVVAGKLALASSTAFAAVYFRSRLRHVIFCVVFVALLLPLEVRIVPTYAVAANLFGPLQWLMDASGLTRWLAAVAHVHVALSLNLLDTYAGLSLPIMASATGTFLFRQFYLSVPPELSEAARMDGAGPLRFFIDILLPVSRTNFAALGVITFLSTWKDYMWPLIATSHPAMRTIALGIASFAPSDADPAPEWNLIMAAALIALLPPLLVVALAQRWFVRGMVGVSK